MPAGAWTYGEQSPPAGLNENSKRPIQPPRRLETDDEPPKPPLLATFAVAVRGSGGARARHLSSPVSGRMTGLEVLNMDATENQRGHVQGMDHACETGGMVGESVVGPSLVLGDSVYCGLRRQFHNRHSHPSDSTL